MQKYPLCQVYKYPTLSLRSLFLFSFFVSVWVFFKSFCSVCHALWSCLLQWHPGHPCRMLGAVHCAHRHPPQAPCSVAALGKQAEQGEMAEDSASQCSCGVFFCEEDCKLLLVRMCVCWEMQPAPRIRRNGHKNGCKPNPGAPTYPAGTSGLWLGFKVATGVVAPGQSCGWHVVFRCPRARTSRSGVWSQAVPSRLPHNLA